MEATNVIIRPLVTEKSTQLQNSRNAYAFQVSLAATKPAIKQAIDGMNRLTEDFAALRMDRSVKQALAGKNVANI